MVPEVPAAPPATYEEVAAMIDHSLLRPELTDEEIGRASWRERV